MSTLPRKLVLDFAHHALIVLGFNAVIGIGLALRNDNPLVQMIYSQSIGLSIWVCVDFGRLLLKRDPRSNWPTGWRMALLMGIAVPAGYAIGVLIGDASCGCSPAGQISRSPRMLLAYLFLAVVVSVSISWFFHTRGRSRTLARVAAQARREAAETQLMLLASQLEPHMLFNTLANLRVLITLDPPRAQAMLDRLVAFMRATLNASRSPLHPLADEFARVDDYLALMKVRMGERLQVELDLPEALRERSVPPLLLQPLVENAIKHGLEPHVGGGRLRVWARSEGRELVLAVRDTGAGLSGAPSDGTRFGLTQVRERLSTLYGSAASLTLAPADDAAGGTLATIRMPLDDHNA